MVSQWGLLCCWCCCLFLLWAQAESGGAYQDLQKKDTRDELRALRDMVVEQRLDLRNTKAEL